MRIGREHDGGEEKEKEEGAIKRTRPTTILAEMKGLRSLLATHLTTQVQNRALFNSPRPMVIIAEELDRVETAQWNTQVPLMND